MGGLIPIPLSLAATGELDLSRSVGLAFAVAASTLCPLLVLGIWWRGLTAVGRRLLDWWSAGVLSGTAVTVAVAGGIDDDVLGGWPAVMIGYPAAVTVPLAFVTMIAGQPLDAPPRLPTSRRSSPACTCPSGWGWASSGCPGG